MKGFSPPGSVTSLFRDGRRRTAALEIATISVGLLVFAVGAHRHGELVNTDMSRTDQSSYLAYAKNVAERPFDYVGGRNQMPIYPYLQAIVYDGELEDVAFFERAKAFNIWLGALLLICLYLLFRTSLSPPSALTLWLITAFSVFMFRAAYVQAELLFYTLFFVVFYVTLRLLRDPSWVLAALAGGALALAHLTKASVLPALLLFLGFVAVRMGRGVYRRLLEDRPAGKWLLREASFPILVVLTFLVLVSPYERTSRERFGRYFYNVNSTFYMWYDSWEEARAGTRAHGDRVGWPDLPEEEIPDPAQYLEEHTGAEIVERMGNGISEIWQNTSGSYGYFKYVVFYLALAAGAAMLKPRAAARLFHRQPAACLFVPALLGAYLLLYAWYAAIASGNRLPLALFLPLMWSLFLFLEGDELGTPVLRVGRHGASWRTLLHAAVVLALAADLVFFLWPRLLEVYAGR